MGNGDGLVQFFQEVTQENRFQSRGEVKAAHRNYALMYLERVLEGQLDGCLGDTRV